MANSSDSLVKDHPRRNSSFVTKLGVLDVIAVSIAGVAPTLSMNLGPQQPEMHVGRAVPMAFALGTVAMLLVGWCFARLARSHPNAGSAYGYAASALGPRWGLIAGWALLGTYMAFALTGVTGCGLFGANLASRLHAAWQPSELAITLTAIVATGILSFFPARKSVLFLILVEGTAIIVMIVMSAVVLWDVTHGGGPAKHVPIRDLFIPSHDTGFSQIALAMSFVVLSFGGFEQAATLGEEVKKSRRVIPGVLIATILLVGFLYTLITAAEIAGFGRGQANLHRFLSSTSLLADLSSGYFGTWFGDFLDVLATISAFGCSLAPILASSRILFALFRDVSPLSRIGSVSRGSGNPCHATAALMTAMALIYMILKFACRASADDIFFWTSTFSALTLLSVYLLVVFAASRSLARSHTPFRTLKQVIPALAASSIAYTLWTCLVAPAQGAYRYIPWLALIWVLVPVFAVALHPSLAEKVAKGLLRVGNHEPELSAAKAELT
jgi:amino acid transporter